MACKLTNLTDFTPDRREICQICQFTRHDLKEHVRREICQICQFTRHDLKEHVRREICQICQFTRHDLKEHVNQENLISIFGRSISVRSPPKLNLYLRGNQTINMDDSYLGMLQEDPFAPYNYYGSQVYVNVPATSPGPSSVHFHVIDTYG